MTASTAATALSDVPGLLAASDTVTATTDADSASISSVAGTTLDIPKDAADPVSIGIGNGPKVSIELPNTESAGPARTVAPGTVVYPSTGGAANAVQATEDGGVRMMTVIDSASAPTDYAYKMSVPGGSHVEITADGAAAVLDQDGQLITAVDPAWAKDANGTAVKTSFSTDGTTLTQHVDHAVPGVAYPVVADPFWNIMGNYVGCIFGVGVPVGLAIAIALYPPSWSFLIRSAASIGASGRVPAIGAVMWYLNAVHARCAAFIRS
ncbi:hypothetical protein C8250_028945 [Streptomyces sp. So13.3]|uniref:hypothetical protein n=1 Tax=Streptomyces sp. So13.3 TaxID=2136173 RepID=UPI001106BAC1|nr:hypothetical protein [Streptomyces sp. So13.3]QNA75380.1 hypothetical protein C8250_028945 [Streptomyces sp. So13.3]